MVFGCDMIDELVNADEFCLKSFGFATLYLFPSLSARFRLSHSFCFLVTVAAFLAIPLGKRFNERLAATALFVVDNIFVITQFGRGGGVSLYLLCYGRCKIFSDIC